MGAAGIHRRKSARVRAVLFPKKLEKSTGQAAECVAGSEQYIGSGRLLKVRANSVAGFFKRLYSMISMCFIYA